ncbi:S41 family peptidase [Parasphingorhabdus litoris]|uniref:S41 family peptidase n=1 Tax=Parasphingorhabdus litoris TaxID=394733 RepID=A0ABN1A9J5_9SPHN|nr:S41 family peptidase [Parasphingorhabdus litoris]
MIYRKMIATGAFATALAMPSAGCAQSNNQAPEPDYDAATMLTPAQVASDVALAEQAYERIHPGYTRYTDAETLKEAWAAIAAKAVAQKGMTIGDFYLEIQKALTLIRCDHTKAELPNQLAKERNITPVYLPLRWTLIEDRAIVTVPGETGLRRGDEILAIDGRPIAEMIAEVAPLIPVDGFTEWSRRSGISESLEFRGGAVDHFGALLWDIESSAAITVVGSDGTKRDVTVKRVIHKKWTALGKLAVDAPAANFKDAVGFQRLGSKSAYLKVDTFVNYRDPVKPGELFDPIFDALEEEGRENLILDLRKNGGGSSDAQQALTSYLFDKPVKLATDARVKTLNHKGLEDYLWTWDKRAINPNALGFRKNDDGTYSLRSFVEDLVKPIKPAKNRFTGKLVVLTSDSNSSASASLIALLKGEDRAILVGQQTGGSPDGATGGLQFTLTVPESKVRMRIPMIRYYNDLKGFDTGQGIRPDISVPLTVDVFRAGYDPVLEIAKTLIK